MATAAKRAKKKAGRAAKKEKEAQEQALEVLQDTGVISESERAAAQSALIGVQKLRERLRKNG